MEEFLLPIFRNKVKIIASALPEGNAAVLGAAALIWNEINTIINKSIFKMIIKLKSLLN